MIKQEQPPFVYGTAWKREKTESLVTFALQTGFTSFDTAAQPKHYREYLVGEAIRSAFSLGIIKSRSDIQVHYTRPPISNKKIIANHKNPDPNEILPTTSTRFIRLSLWPWFFHRRTSSCFNKKLFESSTAWRGQYWVGLHRYITPTIPLFIFRGHCTSLEGLRVLCPGTNP